MSKLPALGSRGEGWVALQGACFALIAAAWLAAPRGPGGGLAVALSLAGYATAAMDGVVLLWAAVELRRGRALTAVPHPRAGAALVESGPYRLIRHPIYSGLLLGALGLALDHLWVGSIAAAAVLAVVLDLKRRREEAWLRQQFPAYQGYERRTKALIPNVY
jgi:protein-S-isoprenylcysteine O-methyltransferase Ste14